MKWLIIAAVFMGVLAIAIILEASQSDAFIPNVPPTRAFSEIVINGVHFKAAKYNDALNLSSDFMMNGTTLDINVPASTQTNSFGTIIIDGVAIKALTPNATLTINTLGSLSTSVTGDTVTIKLTQISCPVLQGLKGVDANGNLFCAVI